MPLLYFCCVTNVAFVEGVKVPLFHNHIFDCTNSTLDFFAYFLVWTQNAKNYLEHSLPSVWISVMSRIYSLWTAHLVSQTNFKLLATTITSTKMCYWHEQYNLTTMGRLHGAIKNHSRGFYVLLKWLWPPQPVSGKWWPLWTCQESGSPGGITVSQDEHKNLPVKDGHFPLGTSTQDEKQR